MTAGGEYEDFLRSARKWLKVQHRLAAGEDFLQTEPLEASIREVRALFEDRHADTSLQQYESLMAAAVANAWDEFAEALSEHAAIPKGFLDHFEGRVTVSWLSAAQAYFAQRLKDDPRVRTVVMIEQLTTIRANQEGLSASIDSVLIRIRDYAGALSERFQLIEDRLDALIGRQPDQQFDRAAIGEEIARAIAEGCLAEQVARHILLRHSSQHSLSQTAVQVQARCDKLTERFFGREDEFAALDAFAASRERGIMVVCATAGGGKSALLANWTTERAKLDPRTVWHFISNQNHLTTSVAEVAGHLAAQITLAEGVGSEGGDARAQNLYALLSAQVEPLVLVLDGLDEAASIIEPFIEADLPPHVRVIISGRAEPDAWPAYLKCWRRRESKDFQVDRLDLAGLSVPDVLLWLEDYVCHLDLGEMDRLAARLHKTTDGQPLFLSYVLEDFARDLPDAKGPQERLGLIGQLPAPFTRYLVEEMDRLPRLDKNEPAWTSSHRSLFGLLAGLLGPIHAWEIFAIFGSHEIPDLATLEHRFTRWLSISGEGADRLFSFAHPLLAGKFAEALAHERKDAEDRLIEWASEAWRPISNRSSVRRGGAPYALDWLPAHLLTVGDQGGFEAAQLLASADFLDERLRDPARASGRLIAHASMWLNLDAKYKSRGEGVAWDAFWAENEAPLTVSATSTGLPQGSLRRVVINCLSDCGIFPTDRSGLPRAFRSASPPRRNLIRSLDNAHSGSVSGVVEIDGRLVSWGGDGAVRFWSLTGDRLSGGDDNAHSDRINGVAEFDGRLVSWGYDGAVRFWSLTGDRLPGGIDRAHQGSSVECHDEDSVEGPVEGVIEVDGRLVSWGRDGAIRFWSLTGQSLPGGDDKAHSAWVKSVVEIDGRLLSWGYDGAIRFWSLTGERLPGGDDKAHSRSVMGLTEVDGRLVSWGSDGAIRFWSLAGDSLPGGGDKAHAGVGGVIEVDGRLVSWGGDGAVRFWSLAGDSLPGGIRKASPYILSDLIGVDGRLVSLDHDGAIRFWSLTGARLPGGDDHAHYLGSVVGVAEIDGRLVSWGADGAIRFWSLTGDPLLGGDNQAHSEFVNGVIEVDGRLVSWGDDGAIRFWSLARERVSGGANRAHSDPVFDVIEVDGRLVAGGKDGAIRLWSLTGDRLPSSDSRAHSGSVKGVSEANGRLVSWGYDGAIRFWSLTGEQLLGGIDRAHPDSSAEGVIEVDSRLVSWGADGAIRFWSLTGERRTGGDDKAHSGSVRSVIEIDGRLVSWGYDGAIRLWSLTGERLPGGISPMHPGRAIEGVIEVGSRLVSWDDEGAIRFWSLTGERLPGGDDKAHSSSVMGVSEVNGRLVSWGYDGAIRFWSLAGDRLPGGGKVHSAPIFGVIEVDGRLAGWGSDGAIRFWSFAGDRLPGGDDHAHHSGPIKSVTEIGGRLLSWGYDGAIRSWSLAGDAIETIVVPGGLDHLHVRVDARVIAFGRTVWAYELPAL